MREIPYELPISHPPPFFDRSKERERVRESWSTIPSRRTEGKSFCSNKPEKGKEVEAADEALAIYIYTYFCPAQRTRMVCQWTANLPGTAPRLNNKFRLSLSCGMLLHDAQVTRDACV